MKLFGYTFTLNEEHMIKYVLPYLDRIGYDKLVVYDSGSTDRTVEILSKVPYVEIRNIRCEEGTFNIVKMHKQIESFSECKKYSEEHDNEDVWMTFTDFDEVIFSSNCIFKNTKEMLMFRTINEGVNYDYFCDRMPYLFYDGNDYDMKNPIHYHIPYIRCSDWYSYGSKVTMIKVNDFMIKNVVVGNHSLTVSKVTDKDAINLLDSGLFYGFHLKYIDKDLVKLQSEKNYESIFKHYSSSKEDFFLKRMSEYNELYSASYNISQYYAVRGLYVKDNDGRLKSSFGYSYGGLKIL